ncbi:MAG: adenylate/guanylate cyclase domain-containing protein [Deltaproteobacteria bacterium]|nr:adenylate/guanylate cyclase domain-containing protein [Deltaproteobacteria bacterium]MBW2256982.1 adenylate/guanylate cyclase domain-containing protein [Deltaproteobacteria bacterium]
MDVFLFNLQIAAVSALLIALHSLRERLGLAPLYVATGVLLAFLMVGSRLSLVAPVLGGEVGRYGSLFHLPLIMVAVGLVYTLDGTREARRAIAGIALASLLLGALAVLTSTHMEMYGADLAIKGRERWLHPGLWGIGASTIALVADGLVILVVYQGLVNRLPWMPLFVALALAITCGTVTDGVVFRTLNGQLLSSIVLTDVVGKLTAGVAASIPVAGYVSLQLRRTSPDVRHGLLNRSALDVIALRKRIAELDERVKQVRDVLSRYVVADVVQEILANPQELQLGGELREVTVLFSDIRGYSTLSETQSPTEIIGLLNRYFGAMSGIIDEERGAILEFEGDGILAVFGAPNRLPDAAVRAVRTAKAMIEEVDRLNEEWNADGSAESWRAAGVPSFRIRVGIHSGPVVVGNIGSETRMKYAVIGDTVNVAARVENLNKKLGTMLLFTRATADQIEGADIAVQNLGRHQVKGRAEHIEVLSPVDVPPMVDAIRALAEP